MPHFDRHFTVDEANALLPELREILAQIRRLSELLVDNWEKAMPVLLEARANGGGKESHPYLQSLRALNARFRRLGEKGVQLKGINDGLVDFPAWRGDREVFLCWRLGEERVAYWHDLEAGFAGRQSLEG